MFYKKEDYEIYYEKYVYPEYESLKKIAIEKDIPLKELYKLQELN